MLFKCNFCAKKYKRKAKVKKHVRDSPECWQKMQEINTKNIIDELNPLDQGLLEADFKHYDDNYIKHGEQGFAMFISREGGYMRNKIITLGSAENPLVVFKDFEGNVVKEPGMIKIMGLLVESFGKSNPQACKQVFGE